MAEPDAAPGRSREPLSLERIVNATLELLDEQGIGVVTMRSVGERLGVRGMSLYRYVNNREDLFDAVVERIVSELDDDPDIPTRPTDGWRAYLASLARGVRRYAIAHPHAFPLVATRPSAAPWMNPPLRSLRWIEALLTTLRDEGFTDDEVLFAYRSFNSYLLGFLLLETSAMAMRDPKPGDGSFQSSDASDGTDPVDPADPVPGGLSPTRQTEHRELLARTSNPGRVLDPVGEVDQRRFPLIHALCAGLTAPFYDDEFEAGLHAVLDRIDRTLGTPNAAF